MRLPKALLLAGVAHGAGNIIAAIPTTVVVPDHRMERVIINLENLTLQDLHRPTLHVSQASITLQELLRIHLKVHHHQRAMRLTAIAGLLLVIVDVVDAEAASAVADGEAFRWGGLSTLPL